MTIDPRNAPYNCDGTGVTDCTTAFNSAIAAAVGVTDIDISYGTFLISGPLTISGQLWMHGGNENATTININSATSSAIQITGNGPVHLERFTVASTTTGGQTTGSLIQAVITSGQNSESSFDRLIVKGAYNSFDLTNCAYFRMNECNLSGFANVGIIVKNNIAVDTGDSVIDRLISIKNGQGGSAGGGTHILQYSSGGLRINNSKLLAGDYGYELDLAASATTGTLLITNNSMEGQTYSAIYMDHETGSVFDNVVISGNEFENQSYPVQIATKDNVVWCRNVVLSGNCYYLPSTGGSAIQINGSAAGTIVGDNVYATGGTTYGVVLGAHANYYRVGPCGMFSVTNPSSNSGTGNTINL